MENYGIGVVVLLFNREDEILIGKRKGAHGAGTWSLPGGKLERKGDAGTGLVQLEDPQFRISEELKEETDIVLAPDRFSIREWMIHSWEDSVKGPQKWITLFTEAELYHDVQARVMEPDKCEQWQFVKPIEMQCDFPLFHPLENYLKRFPVQSWPRFKRR